VPGRIFLLLLVIKFTKCRIGSTVYLPFVNPKRFFGLESLNISLARISFSGVFSIVGRRDIGLCPLPSGLGIWTTIELFQSLGIRPSQQDWLKKFRSLSLKEAGRFRVKDVCKFVFSRRGVFWC